VPIGRYLDAKSPCRTLLLGACLVGNGTVAIGLVREEWHTFPAFVLLGCGFACIHTITFGKIVTRWFVRDRARAMAAPTFGAGFGGAILVPLNAFVIGQWGVLASGIVLATVALGIIGPIALWVIKDGPEAVGQNPDGHATAELDEAHAREIEHDSRLWTLDEAFRTVAFWSLSSCFAIGMLAQGSYLVHQMIFLQSTFGMIGNAWIVTITTLMGLVGRIGFMLIGKRLAPRVWVTLMFAIQAVSFLFLATGTSELWLTVGSALFGLTMGVIVVLQPLATAAVFGQPSFGRIYGPIYMSIRIGAALGPMLAGILVVSTGNYQSVWMLLGCGLLVGSAGIFWAMSPRHDDR
jgi:MFS family permease